MWKDAFDWEIWIWIWIFEIRIKGREIWKLISTLINLSLVSPFFLGRGEVCGHTRKDLNCFQEQLSRKHTHNKQEKTKHCLLEQFYKSFFSFPKVPNRTVIKEMHKIMIWIHLLKPTSWTDFSEGGDEIRFEFRVRLQNLKSLFLMQSNAP